MCWLSLFEELRIKLFQYPRHTWQSWRNRYVKTLQLLPMDKLQQLAAKATDDTIDPEQNVSEPSKNNTSNSRPRPLDRPVAAQDDTSRLHIHNASHSSPQPPVRRSVPTQDHSPKPN